MRIDLSSISMTCAPDSPCSYQREHSFLCEAHLIILQQKSIQSTYPNLQIKSNESIESTMPTFNFAKFLFNKEQKERNQLAKRPVSTKDQEVEDTTESSQWSESQYGPGWDKTFDPSPANVTEAQMKAT